MFKHLRFRYVRDIVKSTLKKIVKPNSPAAPIQNQFLSVKMFVPSRIAIPSLLETPFLSYQH